MTMKIAAKRPKRSTMKQIVSAHHRATREILAGHGDGRIEELDAGGHGMCLLVESAREAAHYINNRLDVDSILETHGEKTNA